MRNAPTLAAFLAAALLAGCSSGASPVPVANTGLTPASAGMIPSLRVIQARQARSRSARQKPFVDVAAVNAPQGNQTIVSSFGGISVWGANGRLNALLTTGISSPEGITTDSAGNLYVVNALTANVLVYPKPYTTLSFALNDFHQDPNDVAVSSSGIVAVTNIYNTVTGGPGTVNIYAKGATAPCATIADPNWHEMGFDAFDAAGNLYVNGINTAGTAVVVGRISGGCKAKSIQTLRMGNALQSLGSMQVAGGKLLMSDPAGVTLYAFEPSRASIGSAVSKVVLPHAVYPTGFALAGAGKLWTADYQAWLVYEYAYPGGALVKAHKSSLTDGPYSIALNPAPALGASSPDLIDPTPPAITFVHACETSQLDEQVLCHALIRTDLHSSESKTLGVTPADLHSAYAIPNAGGGGRIIGIVDAFDNPNAESDLAHYRAKFHLSPCTTANKCFTKLNQRGIAASYPTANTGWGKEISLDLDMASAVCPACRILLVEGDSPSFENLGRSVDTAVAKGANAVSNSYGGPEFTAHDPHYDHKGVLIVASSGDGGYSTGPQEPAAFSTVVAVGGTTLTASTGGRGWTETAWGDGGAGCSQLVKKPAWQHDSGCAGRTLVDIAAIADPATPVAIYDTFGTGGGWLTVGGTSVSTPIVTSLFVLSGNAASQTAAQNLWKGAGTALFDVTTGSDGACFPFYLCTSGAGFDAPTGWGTPNGLGAL
jgi:hypothetical protein